MSALSEVADELYALPLPEFTATRKERAKAARADGDADLAKEIAALPKPTVAAWAVNVLAREEPDLVEQVIALGRSLREAQENLDAAELRELTRQRRRLTAAVTRTARGVAADLGQRLTEAVATQVEETLHAAMVDDAAASAVRRAVLVSALSVQGFAEVDLAGAIAVDDDGAAVGRPARAGATTAGRAARRIGAGSSDRAAADQASPGRAGLSVVPDDEDTLRAREEEARRQALEAARQATADAEAAETKARAKRQKAAKRVAKLQARALQLQAELDEVRRRAGSLEHDLEVLDDDLAAAEEKRDAADRRHQEASVSVEAARSALAELDG